MKRVLSFLLAMVMLLSVTAGISITAQATSITQSQAVAWVNSKVGQALDYDGVYGAQCVDLTKYYYAYLGVPAPSGNANQYANGGAYCPSGWSYQGSPSPGDIAVWTGGTYGHVAIVTEIRGSQMVCVEQNYANKQYCTANIHNKDANTYIRPNFYSAPVVPSGSEMSSGYDRMIPDGDYLIANAGTNDKSVQYYIDIEGTAQPAAAGTNVSLCGPLKIDPPSYEIWTLKYSNGFYTIMQKGTNMSLDVSGASKTNEANIIVSTYHGGSNQRWAISRNGRNGYRIQAKNSGYSLDVAKGGINKSGSNLQQYVNDDTDAQAWLFIPYNPAQTLVSGRYVLISAMSDNLELDVDGDTGNVPENTNVQIWSDSAPSRYNSFDVEKLSNGYYKIKHAASGRCLDVQGGVSTYSSNIAVHTNNGTLAQQWAITKDGYNGGYVIRSRCSGYPLDVAGARTTNGTNVIQSPFHGGKNQTWKFVKAEYTIKYDGNGGIGAPSSQIKYYKSDLSLSTLKPTRSGYIFTEWNTKPDGSGLPVASGAVYGLERDITLYAQWKAINNTFNGKVSGFKCAARTANAEKVQWNSVKTATGYQVQISNAAGNKWSAYANLKASVTSYTFKNLAAGSNYKFRVRYYIKTAEGNKFSQWVAIVSPTLPSTTEISKFTMAKTTFTAQWKQNTSATGYQLQYSTSSKFANAKNINIKSNKIVKTTVKNLKSNTTYYVRFRTYKTVENTNYFARWKVYKVKTK